MTTDIVLLSREWWWWKSLRHNSKEGTTVMPGAYIEPYMPCLPSFSSSAKQIASVRASQPI